MPRRGDGLALGLALGALLLTAGPAAADPSDVYVDYATDGTIECTHSRGDLEGILTDASINEYGDPLTLTRLRIAVRRQLAAGCVRGGTAPAAATTSDAEGGATGAEPAPPTTSAEPPAEGEGAEGSPATAGQTTAGEPTADATAPPTAEDAPTQVDDTTSAVDTVAAAPSATEDDDGTPVGLVGAGVLAVVLLAGGGWLARRALTRSP